MCAAAGQGATADRAKAGRELRLISVLRLVALRLVASSRSSSDWPKDYQSRLELQLPPFGCVYLTPSACSAVPPAPLALARGFALYDAGTTTDALHMHRRIQTRTHKTMRCELQSVVPDARALLHAAPCQCQCGSRNRVSGTR